MNSHADDIQILLKRVEDLSKALDSLSVGDTIPESSLVVQTVTVSSYPTTAQRFYGVQAVEPSGTEDENQTGSFGTPTGTFFAFNVGAAVPPSGTKLRVRLIAGYWVFRY